MPPRRSPRISPLRAPRGWRRSRAARGSRRRRRGCWKAREDYRRCGNFCVASAVDGFMEVFHLLLLAGIGVLSFGLALFGAAVGLVLGHLRLPLLVYALGSPIVGAATNLAISGLG